MDLSDLSALERVAEQGPQDEERDRHSPERRATDQADLVVRQDELLLQLNEDVAHQGERRSSRDQRQTDSEEQPAAMDVGERVRLGHDSVLEGGGGARVYDRTTGATSGTSACMRVPAWSAQMNRRSRRSPQRPDTCVRFGAQVIPGETRT